MLFFKKRKEKENKPVEDVFASYERKVREEAKDKMKLNYLSPAQIEKVIENNKDIDFLDDEIKTEMDYPDIEYLAEILMPEVKEDMVRKDIPAEDVVKGAIVGDIIGSKYEFTEHDYAAARIEELPPEFAQFTDDTVLSIATMRAILENNKEPDFRQAYIDAYHKYPRAGYGSTFVGWALGDKDNTAGYHSMANGCCMRISFIPAYYEDIKDVIKHTIKSVIVTHDHIESVKAAVVLSVCIWMALHNYTKEEIYDYCKKHYWYPHEDRRQLIYQWCQYDLNVDLSSLVINNQTESLYSNYAVPFAIKCFYETESYEECMREILSHFCDTDTICAIAGGLCYAYYGMMEFDMEEMMSKYNVPL